MRSRVTKIGLPKSYQIDKETKFEGGWIKLVAKSCIQRQSFTKYLRLNLVFMRKRVLRESLIFVFQVFFASINKTFILTGILTTRLLFYAVLRLP